MSPITNAFQTLFSGAKENLSLDELDTLAILAEEAGNEARRLSGVCSALACLVENDEDARVPSGSFQDPSVTDRHNRATDDRHIGASLNRL